MKWPVLGEFGPLIPEIGFDLAETPTGGSLHEEKKVFEESLKAFNFG